VGLDLLTLAFERPAIDWHAIAPELVLLTAGCLITLVDIVFLEKARPYTAALAGIGLLATAVPLLTLAVDGTDRVMFDGAYVVDEFSLVMKALFLLAGYVVVLLSTNYVAEGDYWENEYYGLLLASLMGMVMMASARDLVSIFVALELLSIPAYLLVAWRKRDLHSTEAGLKYYLMGVFASAVCSTGCRCSTASPVRPCCPISATRWRGWGHPRRWSRWASSSWWPASPSRSRRCRSTPGLPTCTRAPPPR
jgi:NADH-quinone oxidoreductase subunit N